MKFLESIYKTLPYSLSITAMCIGVLYSYDVRQASMSSDVPALTAVYLNRLALEQQQAVKHYNVRDDINDIEHIVRGRELRQLNESVDGMTLDEALKGDADTIQNYVEEVKKANVYLGKSSHFLFPLRSNTEKRLARVASESIANLNASKSKIELQIGNELKNGKKLILDDGKFLALKSALLENDSHSIKASAALLALMLIDDELAYDSMVDKYSRLQHYVSSAMEFFAKSDASKLSTENTEEFVKFKDYASSTKKRLEIITHTSTLMDAEAQDPFQALVIEGHRSIFKRSSPGTGTGSSSGIKGVKKSK